MHFYQGSVPSVRKRRTPATVLSVDEVTVGEHTSALTRHTWSPIQGSKFRNEISVLSPPPPPLQIWYFFVKISIFLWIWQYFVQIWPNSVQNFGSKFSKFQYIGTLHYKSQKTKDWTLLPHLRLIAWKLGGSIGNSKRKAKVSGYNFSPVRVCTLNSNSTWWSRRSRVPCRAGWFRLS